MEEKKESLPLLVILGSSVANGRFAKNDEGWTQLLAKALQNDPQRKWQVLNFAEDGSTAAITIQIFKQVEELKPDAVLIGLSLGNEGLSWLGERAYDSFKDGMLKLVKMIHKIGAVPILGGLYPNNLYSAENYKLLLKMQKEMESWPNVIVFEFLSVLDDGKGHWKETTYNDSAHPNTYGHQLMFQQVPIEIFRTLPLSKQKSRM